MGNHTAFNKWNPTELLGQLLVVLNKRGLKDLVKKIKHDRLPETINKAWLATKGMTPDEAALLRGRYAAGALNRAVRIAHSNRELRPLLLPGLCKVAEKWIQKAVKRPGRVLELTGKKPGELTIADIDKALKTTTDPSDVRALNMAKTLVKGKGWKKGK